MREPRVTRMRRLRGDHGASLVEMALVMPILALFIFGIITFGILLSFKQTMTQSAAEGARAAAVAPRPDNLNLIVQDRAAAATAQAVSGFDEECGLGALDCEYRVADCANLAVPDADGGCIVVRLTYDYSADPLLPELPIISAFTPDQISSESVVQINEVAAP